MDRSGSDMDNQQGQPVPGGQAPPGTSMPPTPAPGGTGPGMPPKPAPTPEEGGEEHPKSSADIEEDFERQVNKAGYYKPNQAKKSRGVPPALIAVIALVVIIGLVYYIYAHYLATTPPPVRNVTVTPPFSYNITGCTNITRSGTYRVTHNISTSLTSGTCINIATSNVRILGPNMDLDGTGPYNITVAPTYGIKVDNVRNITIYGLKISKFSYGIYFSGSSDLNVTNSTFRIITLSGIYFLNSPGAIVKNVNVTQVSSVFGGIFIMRSDAINISNSIIQNNAYYGVVLSNATQNHFFGDKFLNNPIDLLCSSSAGFRSSGTFSKTSCQVNNYCNFAYCAQTNIPYNISDTILGPTVTTCGTISHAGTYNLGNGLSLTQYINVSEPGQSDQTCLLIKSPNVRLDCNGYSVINAGYGIYAFGGPQGIYNVSVSNCQFVNDSKGVYFDNLYSASLSGIRVNNVGYGIYLNNVTESSVSNSFITGSIYGVYLASTAEQSFSNVTSVGNRYGIYIASGGDNSYEGGVVKNNTNVDLFCSATAYNATNIFQGYTCGSTDCDWASHSCKILKLPPIGVYYLHGCTSIVAPGSYALSSGVTSAGTCMNIDTSNVTFSCGGHSVIATGAAGGSAFLISSKTNVSIMDCNITGYNYAISAYNSSRIDASNLTVNASQKSGLYFYNDSLGYVNNVTIASPFLTGVVTNKLSYSTMTNVLVTGSINASGFVFGNSTNNTIAFDTSGFNHADGFIFAKSKFNTVYNDTGNSNLGEDFYCKPDSSGLYAEYDGINSGNSKIGCAWLVELPVAPLQLACGAISIPDKINLAYDALYTSGSACFSIYNKPQMNSYANRDVINCNGHTIMAVGGGSFIDDINASGVTIENCYLKNFTNPIEDTGNALSVINETIGTSNVSILATGVKGLNVTNTLIENASYGILSYNSSYGSINYTSMKNIAYGVELSGGESYFIGHDNINSTESAFLVLNSTLDTFLDNIFTSASAAGISCSTKSGGLSTDSGGNICSLNNGCTFMKSSKSCKAA
jgi:nitrous oxidase accessory protein NosD